MLPFSNQRMPTFPVCSCLWCFFPSCLCAHVSQRGCVIRKTCHVLCSAFIAWLPPLLCQLAFTLHSKWLQQFFPRMPCTHLLLFVSLINMKAAATCPTVSIKKPQTIGGSLTGLGESWGNSGKKREKFLVYSLNHHRNQRDIWSIMTQPRWTRPTLLLWELGPASAWTRAAILTHWWHISE